MDVIQTLVERMTDHAEPCTLCREAMVGPDDATGVGGVVFFMPGEEHLCGAEPGNVRLVGWRVCNECAKDFDSPREMAVACRENIIENLGKPPVLQ